MSNCLLFLPARGLLLFSSLIKAKAEARRSFRAEIEAQGLALPPAILAVRDMGAAGAGAAAAHAPRGMDAAGAAAAPALRGMGAAGAAAAPALKGMGACSAIAPADAAEAVGIPVVGALAHIRVQSHSEWSIIHPCNMVAAIAYPSLHSELLQVCNMY